MTNPNPNPPTQFKPGESGNVSGRPAIPEDIKEARKLNKIEMERVLNHFISMTGQELKAYMGRPETTALELMVGKVVAIAIQKGDEKRLGFILDRLGFVVKQKHSHDGGEDNSPIGLTVAKIQIEERIKQLLEGKNGKN
jgi:hypothetical protein